MVDFAGDGEEELFAATEYDLNVAIVDLRLRNSQRRPERAGSRQPLWRCAGSSCFSRQNAPRSSNDLCAAVTRP